MIRPFVRCALAAASITTALAAQTVAADGVATTRPVSATLIPGNNRSAQGDPIRWALRIENRGPAVRVRPAPTAKSDLVLPFEVEHRVAGAWRSARASSRPRLRQPARDLTPPTGRRLDANAVYTFEAELSDLGVVGRPGRLRARFLLEYRPSDDDHADWTGFSTPFCELEIRAHPGNAATLLHPDAGYLRARYHRMLHALGTTEQCRRNRGPFGASAREGTSRWRQHAPVAEQVVADRGLSATVRARARLVLAYDALERAIAPTNPRRDPLLALAAHHLDAIELAASPPASGLAPLPSGGLEALRQVLAAAVDRHRDGADVAAVHDRLAARWPFFAYWWRWELSNLLLR